MEASLIPQSFTASLGEEWIDVARQHPKQRLDSERC